LFLNPSHSIFVGVVRPNYASLVFGATSDHLVHQSDVLTPGDVTHPVVMTTYFLNLSLLFSLFDKAYYHFVIISSSDKALWRWLELYCVHAGG